MLPGIATCAKPEAERREGREAARRETMQHDAVLPADIAPATPAPSSCQRVLLTGATGFLGRHVLRELLARDLEVICLIRAQGESEAQVRLEQTLRAGRTDPRAWSRARAVGGDTTRPRLGLGARYDVLAASVDAVYHCAAEVSWVKGYAQLRRTNVLAALEVIRFACALRAKPVTFVSSLAVCFARGARPTVNESTDMLPWLDHMPLGYAQSKCIAESLLRQASQRGLPVTIVRAGLLAGDSVTGASNPSDVLSALLQECVAQGVAFDIDWQVDSVPVDYAARAVVALSSAHSDTLTTYHLRHSRPRHWRELVLWLNLFGYRVRLLPVSEWNQEIFETTRKGGALSSYRRFFMGARLAQGGERPFETYIAGAQAELDCDTSRAALVTLGIEEPTLDTPLLRRYVDHYARLGALPPHPWHSSGGHGEAPDATLRQAVAATLGVGPGGARGLHWEALPFDASAGILNEIATVRVGTDVGMYRYRVTRTGGPPLADIVVKAKARDSVLQGLVAEMASLCDPELQRCLGAFPQALGLDRSHLRELALYRDAPASIARYMPRCFGVAEDAQRGCWSVAMEHVHDAQFLDGAQWSRADVDMAVEAAASIHSVFYRNEGHLQSHAWAASEVTSAQAGRMTQLWYELARFAAPRFGTWAGPALCAWQTHLIGSARGWWHELCALPRTLIHNDFNARNLAFRGGHDARRLCVLDWELARIGVPQHDLAELLCFVWPHAAGRDELEHWLELHRARLSEHAALPVSRSGWRRGFVLALQHLLVERLPLYALADRFKPQAFLPGIVRNWARLYDLSLALEAERASARVVRGSQTLATVEASR
jgi:thioester reductase-like protein